MAISILLPRRGLLQASAATLIPRPVLVRLETRLGAIDIAVMIRQAPLSAGDFLKYVDRHCYDGGSFSRVVRPDNDHGSPGIDVVQGGVRGDVTPWAPIAHETTRQTGLRHRDGTVSLPRDKVGTGSGSEIFICIGAQPALDFGGRRNPDRQGFAAFGRVVRGMAVVRAIWRMDAGGASPDPYTAGQMLRHPVSIISCFRAR